jgi:hypothetical protein
LITNWTLASTLGAVPSLKKFRRALMRCASSCEKGSPPTPAEIIAGNETGPAFRPVLLVFTPRGNAGQQLDRNMLNTLSSQNVNSVQPRLVASPARAGGEILGLAEGTSCACGARVRPFPRVEGGFLQLFCDQHHLVLEVEL